MQRALFFFLLLLFAACWQPPKHKGYTETDTGLFFKLQAFGEGEELPQAGDHLQLHMVYRTEQDSVFLDTRYENPVGKILVPFEGPTFVGSFEEGLAKMHEGDSVSFLVNADSVFHRIFHSDLPHFIASGSLLKVDVLLSKIVKQEELEQELKYYAESYNDWDMKEQTELLKYVKQNYPEVEKDSTGIYFITQEEGSGARAWWDRRIQVHYQASFLDGKIIDSTLDGEPFEFTMGEEGQVLEGFEIGLRKMYEGGKAKFILPSYLAFGAEGSSYFIVPPYTSIVYDVELIKVDSINVMQ